MTTRVLLSKQHVEFSSQTLLNSCVTSNSFISRCFMKKSSSIYHHTAKQSKAREPPRIVKWMKCLQFSGSCERLCSVLTDALFSASRLLQAFRISPPSVKFPMQTSNEKEVKFSFLQFRSNPPIQERSSMSIHNHIKLTTNFPYSQKPSCRKLDLVLEIDMFAPELL